MIRRILNLTLALVVLSGVFVGIGCEEPKKTTQGTPPDKANTGQPPAPPPLPPPPKM